MTLIQSEKGGAGLSKREQITLIVILIAVGLFTALDVFEDWQDGATLQHIVPELITVFLTVGAALYLFRWVLQARHERIVSVREEAAAVRATAEEWRGKAQALAQGITDAISQQFDGWGLSPAEQEVGFLLIKGLSISEISEVRKTSERTIRQQASEIYKKSGLSGRAQLSAFFLEDLFER